MQWRGLYSREIQEDNFRALLRQVPAGLILAGSLGVVLAEPDDYKGLFLFGFGLVACFYGVSEPKAEQGERS